MPNIIFTKNASTFTFSSGRSYPVADAGAVNVPTDYSDGGQLYAYDKGIAEQFFDLVYDHLTVTDYNNFDAWLKTIACGPRNTFTMTDEGGVNHTVRLLDTRNPLRWARHGVYAGTIRLRKEI